MLTRQQIRAALFLEDVRPFQVANQCGCSADTVFNVLKGKSKNAKVRECIANIIGRTVEDVFGEETPNEKAPAATGARSAS